MMSSNSPLEHLIAFSVVAVISVSAVLCLQGYINKIKKTKIYFE